MSYDFVSKKEGNFGIGAFAWPILLEQFGCLFPSMNKAGKYYTALGVDERFEKADLGDNGGFEVTEEEAKIMARMARNFCAIQRSLGDDHFVGEYDFLLPESRMVWPRKISSDFVDQFERFAEWAEKSGGFEIW